MQVLRIRVVVAPRRRRLFQRALKRFLYVMPLSELTTPEKQ